jgi:transposase-like protein
MFCLNLVRDMLMEIIVKCPECCKTWRLDGSVADRRIRCKHCGRLFKVPKPDDVPKAAEVIERTKGTIYVDEDGKTYG